MISEKERWGWVGKISQKKWGQDSVLEIGCDMERQTKQFQTRSSLEVKNMDGYQ